MKRKPKFEVYPAADGYRWRLKAANGRTLAQGEGHTRKADAQRAADTVSDAVMAIAFPMTGLVKRTRKRA